MVVKLSILTMKGDERIELPIEEAQQLVQAEKGQYFVVDSKTRQVIKNIIVEDGQELQLIPRVQGG